MNIVWEKSILFYSIVFDFKKLWFSFLKKS